LGVHKEQTDNREQLEAANVAAATGVQKEQTENREQTEAENVAAATTIMGRTEQTQQIQKALQTEQTGMRLTLQRSGRQRRMNMKWGRPTQMG